MDYREESFRQKFAGAAQHLSVRPEQVVSLKLRENVSSYDEYRQLLDVLQHEAGLQCSEIKADLQGRGYLLGDGKNNLIVVEHETGLELLYIAGSVASLIALVPLVLQGWRALRGQFSGRHMMPDQGMEIRRIDDSGRLHEEHVHDRHFGSFMTIGSILPALATTAGLIETEIRMISRQIQTLNSRVDALEKQRRLPGSSTVQKKANSKEEKKGEQRKLFKGKQT